MDRAGFEPATSALRRQRSYQTELPARIWCIVLEKRALKFRVFGVVYILFRLFAFFKVFSAVETEKSRSSMVAMNVAIFPLHFILVNTSLSFNVVLICKPLGALKLSGETALAIASASLLFSYCRDISASNFFAF